MLQTTSRYTRTTGAIAIAFLTAALLTSPGVVASVQASGDSAGLPGTWMIQVTLRDCTSGAPLGPAIPSLVTFNRDGSINEDPTGAAFAPGQRSSGHGTWTPAPGHTFAQEMIALIQFTTPANLPGVPGFDPSRPVSPGFFAGSVRVSHTIRLTAPDQIESSGTNAFYKSSGELYRSGCSTATGERF